MPDSTIEAIDKIFDFLDKGVDTADRILNRSERTADQGRRVVRQDIIDVEAPVKSAPKKTAKSSSSAQSAQTSTAVARKPHFYITETVDPKSKATIYVVTDGGNARTECSSLVFAQRILAALEKAQ